MPNARGSWTLHAGIKQRWFAQNLDGRFREAWPQSQRNPAQARYHTLNDQEARAGDHPTPYCVYEIADGNVIGHTTGGAQTLAQRLASPANNARDTERQFQEIAVTFKIYGATKAQAIQYSKLVAAAFDKALLTLEDDEHNEMIRGSDFGTPDGDSTYFWTLIYRVRIDCTYAAELS